jgi:4-hydroxy-tetrahydrodipicolinate reductase
MIETASKTIPILYTGNTSLGINVLNEVVKSLTKVLEGFDIEIIEKHHNQKVDAPSGTARMFLKAIEEERQVTPVYGRKGVSKRQSNDVTIHAVRGGTISGEHSIIFAGDDEIIEVKHTALSKKVFAKGAITAARYVETQKSGLFSMKDIF